MMMTTTTMVKMTMTGVDEGASAMIVKRVDGTSSTYVDFEQICGIGKPLRKRHVFYVKHRSKAF